MESEKKKGRGRPKGKIRQAVTVMLRIDEIVKSGGMEQARLKIQNNFSKL